MTTTQQRIPWVGTCKVSYTSDEHNEQSTKKAPLSLEYLDFENLGWKNRRGRKKICQPVCQLGFAHANPLNVKSRPTKPLYISFNLLQDSSWVSMGKETSLGEYELQTWHKNPGLPLMFTRLWARVETKALYPSFSFLCYKSSFRSVQ